MEFRTYNFEKLIDKKAESKFKGIGLLTNQYLKEGNYPIVDQGKSLTNGYTNDNSKIISVEKPIIIFGDHTRIFKFIDFDFAPGADGTKVIVPNYKLINPKLFYLLLKNSKIPNDGYGRHYKHLKELEFEIPSDFKRQEELANILSNKLSSLELMRQAALKQKEAVEALQGALLREVFPYKEGDELPKGWKWEKLDKIFEEVKNQVQPYEDEFKTLPFVGLENVVSHTREYTDEEYNPPASTCFKFDETNILYGKLRPYLNKVYLPTVKGKSSMELIPLKTKNNYSREFLAAVLQSEAVIGDTVKFSTGGRMPRADLKKLKKFEVAIPSDVSKCNELGITVSNKINEFIDLNKKALTQLEAIEALPAAILKEVFEVNKN